MLIHQFAYILSTKIWTLDEGFDRNEVFFANEFLKNSHKILLFYYKILLFINIEILIQIKCYLKIKDICSNKSLLKPSDYRCDYNSKVCWV